MTNITNPDYEMSYREQFYDPNVCVITLKHLFDAIDNTPEVKEKVDAVLGKAKPITILIEGSAFVDNLAIVSDFISGRKNPNDRILLVDISSKSIIEHRDFVKQNFPDQNIIVKYPVLYEQIL